MPEANAANDLVCQTSTKSNIEAKGLSGAASNLSTAAAYTLYDAINRAQSAEELHELARSVWQGYGAGALSDDDASFLGGSIERRRPRWRNTAPGFHKSVGDLASRVGSRFTPRQRPRSLDRKASRDRRRRLGGSSALPDTLRHHYTEGQRAVLCIIASEVKHHGYCDLPIDKIGALAGVCRTTVQTTLHEARRLGHIKITERPVPGRKNLTNIVEITSREWQPWIARGPAAHRPIGSKTANLVSTTKSTDRREREIRENSDSLSATKQAIPKRAEHSDCHPWQPE